MVLIEFMETDDESFSEGITICQGCASTKYPVESKNCPTCGFPNAEYRVRHSIPMGQMKSSYPRSKRSKVESSSGSLSLRNRRDKDRRSREYISRKHTSSRKHLIRSGQVPLKRKNVTPKQKRKSSTYRYAGVKSRDRGIQCDISDAAAFTPNLETATQESTKDTDIITDYVDILSLEEDKYLHGLLEQSYENGRTGSEKPIKHLWDAFRRQRRINLFKILQVMGTGKLKPKATSPKNLNETSSSNREGLFEYVYVASDDESEEASSVDSKARFFPNAIVKPSKVTVEEMEHCYSNVDIRKSTGLKATNDLPRPPIHVEHQVPSRRKRMSFDDHLVKTDDELLLEQEKVFKEAQQRQKQNAFVKGITTSRRTINRRSFEKVAQGNPNANFQPLFVDIGIFPDPLQVEPHEILGVPTNAPQIDIRKQYKGLCFVFHPDKNSHPKAKQYFEKITEAYSKLNCG